MSATKAPVKPLTRSRVHQLVAAAVKARDAGMAQAEANANEWDIRLIDQAIGWFAQTGQPFSANDIRPLLPGDTNVRGLMGARFSALYTQQVIRPIGDRPSLKENTHNKRINVWVAARPDDDTETP